MRGQLSNAGGAFPGLLLRPRRWRTFGGEDLESSRFSESHGPPMLSGLRGNPARYHAGWP